MFGTYKEAIEILKHMMYTTKSPEEATILTKAIAAIQTAWHDEEKAFSRAYDLTPADEIVDEKEIN